MTETLRPGSRSSSGRRRAERACACGTRASSTVRWRTSCAAAGRTASRRSAHRLRSGGMVMSERFPGESAEYRRARNRLLQAEVKLRRQIEAVAAQRRELPLGGTVRTDYEFQASGPRDGETRRVKLSELFPPGRRTLFLYNFMFPEAAGSMTPCPSCTSIIDAVDGAARHIKQRIGVDRKSTR